MKHYLEATKNQPVTVLRLRLELLKMFPNLGEVMMTKESERSVMENLGLMNSLEKKGIEIIYIDEFHFNTRHSRFRGLAKRGSKAFLAINPISFQATFAVAVSKEKIYGIIRSTETMDGAWIRHYVKELLKDRIEHEGSDEMPFIIWMDNISVHTKGVLPQFILQSAVSALIIPAYTLFS